LVVYWCYVVSLTFALPLPSVLIVLWCFYFVFVVWLFNVLCCSADLFVLFGYCFLVLGGLLLAVVCLFRVSCYLVCLYLLVVLLLRFVFAVGVFNVCCFVSYCYFVVHRMLLYWRCSLGSFAGLVTCFLFVWFALMLWCLVCELLVGLVVWLVC